ncbi:MAG: BrnT family toxin, partial [Mariprofundaceae bacterium]|nr:BrnT family toxin [Mariprofundaceae bacterium]
KKLGIKETDFRVVFGRTKIDFDPDKEDDNRKKHGYSLESAADLLQRWIFPTHSTPFITRGPIERNAEIRHEHLGVDDNGNVVFIVTTMRADEVVRVISFRRANKREREQFESLTGYRRQNTVDGTR